MQTQLDADRAQQQRRWDELEGGIRSLDVASLSAHRAWSERQVDLFQVYVEELAARLDELEAPECGPRSAMATGDLASIHDRLDGAIGEAMTVRIELDRLAEQVQLRFDEFSVRLAAVESRLAERSVGGTSAAQTERLDEIERALEHLAARPPSHLGAVEETVPMPAQVGSSAACQAMPDPVARLALKLADADRTKSTDMGSIDVGSADVGSIPNAVPSTPQPNPLAQPNAVRPSVPQPGIRGEAGG